MSYSIEWMDARATSAEIAKRGEEIGEDEVSYAAAVALSADEVVVIEGFPEDLRRIGDVFYAAAAVGSESSDHQHEAWQLQDSGNHIYCAACGEGVTFPPGGRWDL